jgi:transposase
MRQPYPSDINREQFEKIRPILESARKTTKPREVDLYEIFCGILYILKSGCQWNIGYPEIFQKAQLAIIIFKFGVKKQMRIQKLTPHKPQILLSKINPFRKNLI